MRMVKYWCSECRLIFEVEEKYDVPGLKCPDCGHPMFMGRGDVRFENDNTVFMPHPKNRIFYALLAFFFGLIGIHNLYAGFLIRGAIQFILTAVFSWTVIVPLLVVAWAIVEVFFQRKDSTGQKMEGTFLLTAMIGVIMAVSTTTLVVKKFYPHPLFMLSRSFFIRDISPVLSRGHLKNLSMAIRLYSIDNNDFYPENDNAKGLHQLKSGGYLRGVEYYRFPSGRNSRNVTIPSVIAEVDSRLIYLGGLAETVSPDTVIVFEKPEKDSEYVNVLFVNGSVGRVKLPENVKTCEDILRAIYNDEFAGAVRLKQLAKAKKMDAQFASASYSIIQDVTEVSSPEPVRPPAVTTTQPEEQPGKEAAAPKNTVTVSPEREVPEKKEESPIKCFKEDDWSSIVK